MAILFEVEDIPLPFAYYHMLNAACFLFLATFSVGTGLLEYGWVSEFLFIPFLLGIRESASVLW
jgi:hypothetical protein